MMAVLLVVCSSSGSLINAWSSAHASGLALPHVTVARADGDGHRYLQADRDAYTGVVAWYRTKDGKQEKVTAGESKRQKRLAWLYANKKNAQKAVDREWKKLQSASG